MATTSGLTRRRGAGGGAGAGGGSGLSDGDGSNGNGVGVAPRTSSATNVRDSGPETSYESGENGHRIAFDPRDISESAERSKQPKLTLMEEVLLLGLKDKQVCLSWLVAFLWFNLIFSSCSCPRLEFRFQDWARKNDDDGMGKLTACCSICRATCRSGTTTSRTPCAGASS